MYASGNVKNVRYLGGDERNQGGNNMAVEMKQNSNRNDKFKKFKEMKFRLFLVMILNEIYKKKK